ncbi:MAG: helix-turn-helix domain-containing protein [Actinomycetota bacterium]|nr:helix-turn-helix domain-containing protein [Actinomycetota bacterium]
MTLEPLITEAFAQLGLTVRFHVTSPAGTELVLTDQGVRMSVQLLRRALVDAATADRLLADAQPSGGVVFVVADRVTGDARGVLTSRGAGYLDLRGHLALRAEGLVIDADVQPAHPRPPRSGALAGKVGLEVAVSVLMSPSRPAAVREVARSLGRSPSTVSEVLSALRRDDLVDERNTPVGTGLFWQVADRWPTRRTYLTQAPTPNDDNLAQALRLGLDDVEHEPGWALTDSAAAAAYAAPLAVRAGQKLDFFVPSDVIARRAITLLGAASSPSQAQASIRVAPVPAVVHQRADLATNAARWPLAHPVFVALDLAQDAGRGREILQGWTPREEWTRVW